MKKTILVLVFVCFSLCGCSEDNRPTNNATPTPNATIAPVTPTQDITPTQDVMPTQSVEPTEPMHIHVVGNHPQYITISGRTFEILPSAEFLYTLIDLEWIPASDPWQCTSWVDEYGVFHFEPFAGTKLGPATVDFREYKDLITFADALGVSRDCITYSLVDYMRNSHAVNGMKIQKSNETSYVELDYHGNIHYVDKEGKEMMLRNMTYARSEFSVGGFTVNIDNYTVLFDYDYTTFSFFEPIVRYWQEGKTVAEFRKDYGFPDYGEPFFGG